MCARAMPASGLLSGICPEPLAQLSREIIKWQAYNFRSCLTQATDRLRVFSSRMTIDPARYELLGRVIFAAAFGGFFANSISLEVPARPILITTALSPPILSGGNWDFPEGRLFNARKDFSGSRQLSGGAFWFAAHDPRVPGRNPPAAMRDVGVAGG